MDLENQTLKASLDDLNSQLVTAWENYNAAKNEAQKAAEKAAADQIQLKTASDELQVPSMPFERQFAKQQCFSCHFDLYSGAFTCSLNYKRDS